MAHDAPLAPQTLAEDRLYNFAAGPAMLPAEVLEASARALVDYRGMGIGVAELSHRGPEFDAILDEAIERCKSLCGIPGNPDYDVLFLQGGATQLFTTIPMNFLQGSADYLETGEWAKKAIEAARPYGTANVVGSSAVTGYDRVPDGWTATPDASYLYVCTNETINGTRIGHLPHHPTLVADVSSEFMARPIDARQFALIFGGAQKNLGPAGVVVAIVRRDLYARIPKDVPPIFSFAAHAKAKSCLNTPPTFAIYMLLETFRWIERQGGLASVEARNERKATLIYDVLDEQSDFYRATVHDRPENRSRMNVTFHLPTQELTGRFLAEAEARGMVGLQGYRTVGGVRASIYNAMPEAGCALLAEHMRDFAEING
ncbi:MAG: 3-phosphoserine/phosphohydroxythreonine transaminase [Chloroflexi bacterium]|nr:3-phosphoserine/phosphohydroxythreonine transaminase [Chloroflexota bacterium]